MLTTGLMQFERPASSLNHQDMSPKLTTYILTCLLLKLILIRSKTYRETYLYPVGFTHLRLVIYSDFFCCDLTLFFQPSWKQLTWINTYHQHSMSLYNSMHNLDKLLSSNVGFVAVEGCEQWNFDFSETQGRKPYASM